MYITSLCTHKKIQHILYFKRCLLFTFLPIIIILYFNDIREHIILQNLNIKNIFSFTNKLFRFQKAVTSILIVSYGHLCIMSKFIRCRCEHVTLTLHKTTARIWSLY